MDGNFIGSSPRYASLYRGPHWNNPTTAFKRTSGLGELVFIGDQGGWQSLWFNLQQGLNVLNIGDLALHPWQKKFAFYYFLPDSDRDGLIDPIETILGTDPNNPDSDGDGLPDGQEVYRYGTDPFNPDTDGDGYSDAYEIAQGSDPKNPASLPFYSLSVAKAGAGSGSVTSSPSPGLDCGSTCQATYPIRSWVTLQASPSEGSYFAGWSGGGCSGTNPSCKVYFVSPTTIVANFELQKILTVTIEGAGTGWVESTPSGMHCGDTTCECTYTPGTNVTLNAKASQSSQFAGWSGSGCSGMNRSCILTISEDMTIVANFDIRPATSMTTPRWDHTATLLSNGKVLITGGVDEDFNILSWAEIYDPATGTFSPTGSMGLSRVGHTATLLRDGKVMIAGGDPGSGLGWASAEFYDPATGTFSAPQLMMGSRRYWHTSTFLPNGRVIIIGGSPMDDLPEYYDGSTFNLKYSASCLDPHRNRHTATLLPNGKVLLAGGDGPLSSADLYDDSNPCPSPYNPAEMSTPRDGHTATLLPHGNVLIAGGFDGMGTSSTAELYDTNRGIFTPAMSIKVPRDSHTATLLPNGRVLIVGGWGNSEVHSSAELYGGGVFGFTGSMMAPRAGHTATLLQNGKVLIVGGYSINDTILSSAEIYDPETGTFSPPISSDDYIDLIVSKAGAGSGVVTSTPSGLDCGPTCQATYIHDSYVTLQVTPSPGSYFGGWSGGGCSGPNPSCTVHLVTATTVIANFELEKTLTVVKEGAGTGVITSSPPGIDCGSTCQATFPPTVTLYASPLSGSNFAGWSGGGCSGNNPWCIITMAADTTVVANFEPQKILTVTKTGAGSGLVTSSPPGIDCGSTCQATFPPTVTLHASPSPGSYFAGWSGGGCSGTASLCTITLTADIMVNANFEIPIPGTLMTVGRYNHTATLLPDGRVLIAGGWDSANNILPSTELYDPCTSTFILTGPMGTGRVGHTATLLPNGKVLLAGGEESNNPTPCSSAELYDTTTGTVGWASSGSGGMIGIHAWHTATFLPGTGWPYGTVLLTGGFAIPDYCDSVAELYNPDFDFFNTPENPYMISERADHTATFLSNGKVLIAGGYDSGGSILSSAEIFDPTDPQGFFVTGTMQTERAWHTATLLSNGKVLVVGGSVIDFGILSSVELYDPATGMFSATMEMMVARANHTATLLNNGKVLIAGGHGYYDQGVWSSAELYDPVTGEFSTTGSMMVARANHTATLLNNGKVLIIGGYNGIDGPLSSAEIYDPETGLFTPTAPSDNYGLTVSKAGTGAGLVTSTPAGVDCGSTCQATFATCTVVTLQAVASAGSYFAGWSGAGCSGTDPCTVTLSANTTVVATFQLLSVSVVEDAEGDLLLRNCDPANPTFYCSLPPGAPLSLPGYFNIKTARIEQINGGEVELSISLYAPVPTAPPYPFLSYNWTFQGGCVNPSPGNKAGIVIYWNGTTWTAQWVIIENCTPQTVALGDPVPFEFTADGVKVRVSLTEIQTAIDPGEPLFWHASVSRMSVSNGTFPNVVPVDFAPNVMAFNPAPYSTFVYPKVDATWNQGQDIVVPDTSGDLLLRICDSANPSFYCSLPPGEQLPLPGWLDIKSARIAQINASQVELSIALQEPIPQTPPSTYLFVDYFWQFEGGCVQPNPGNKSGITVIWRDWGSGAEWRANWIEITSCNPFTTVMGDSVPFEFTADGVKV